MNFESSTQLEAQRAEKRKARALLLEEAKRKYDIEERRIAAAKAKGEDQWMLPELSKHIDNQEKKLKKKSKKVKKEKKHKKEKKSKKKSSSPASEGSDSDQWVEKTKEGSTKPGSDKGGSGVVKGPVLQRDDWMTLSSSEIPTVSRQELRERIKQDKLQYAEQKSQPEINIDEPGTHEKELNPYWKTGSGGLPEAQQEAITVPKHSLPFLKQAYARCEKLAEESGESLEAIAAERYGSLAQLEVMIMEAEREEELAKEAKEQQQTSESSGHTRDAYGRRNRSNSRDRRQRHRSRSSSRRRTRRARTRSTNQDSSRRHKYRSRSHEKGRRKRSRSDSRTRRRGRSRSRSNHRHQSKRNRSNSKENYKKRKSRSRSREHRRTRSRSRQRARGQSPNRMERRYERRRERSRSSSSTSGNSLSPQRESKAKASEMSRSSTDTSRRFMKPGELPSMDKPKRAFLKPGDSQNSAGPMVRTAGNNQPSWRKPGSKRAPDTSKRPTSDSANKPGGGVDSDSPSSSSSEEELSNESSEEDLPKPAMVALTEDEMNALGAKILKAELMGNDEVAQELKQKLDMARQARESGVKPAPTQTEKVVVLSHADKFGNVRPVDQDEDQATAGGKKRRARKVPTHNKSGERERYFADDDRFNIKDMVQAEKMTSAEDHHLMFSKMAAKVTEKIDDDNQIDDAMINRARLQHDPRKEAARQQQQAKSDSKRLAQTLDNCQYCLENMTKHLIIAVHKNTYLCLPEHQSLNEGHCRIVPIHHCIASTTCDEDVWNEVQEFRQALVKMFAANDDQDCVFMECCRHLRRQPHMMLECVPITRELGDVAPIYFKKAIDESEKEWAQNRKLVDLSKKDIRHSVPKGFPYFSVDFGLDGGFAHVIEDEQTFPPYFGKEVLGGMMDTDSRLWRKPKKEMFEEQRKKVMNFAKMWKPYDFTKQKAASDSE